MRQPQAIAKADAVTGTRRGWLGAPTLCLCKAQERRPTRILLVPRRTPDLTAVALAFQRQRRVSRLTPRHCDTSPGGSYGTPGADTAATRRHIEAECPQRVPFRTQHPLGAVVNRPSVWSDRWIFRAVLVCTRNADSREADAVRKLTFGMNLSLDGYIAAPGDDLGWSVPSDELFQWWSDRVGATGLAL